MIGNPITAIPPVGLPAFASGTASQAPAIPSGDATGFSRLLLDGVQGVSNDMINADKLVHDFSLDDSMPVHQVTYALEQARLSLNLMMQVRNRLVEAYQQMMNMQL